MNRTWKRAVVGLAAVTATLLAGAPTGAAAPPKAQVADMFCFVQPGEATRCASTEAAMREMAPLARKHVLNLWEHPNYEGRHMEVWKEPEPNYPNIGCSPESDFDPPDEGGNIPPLPGVSGAWVSSVRKIDINRCNWILVGPNGYRSAEVENDWPRLGTLGNGWDNRAVRVLVD
jgi:hypothetical protein